MLSGFVPSAGATGLLSSRVRMVNATHRHGLAAALLFLVAMAAPGCSGFDPDAPWTLSSGAEDEPTPIPEGIPIIEHDPVPIESRTDRIDLVEDLVIERGAAPFYRPRAINADPSGNMFVYDNGQNVVAFDRAGNYLHTMGRPGQGPGEIVLGGDIAVVKGNLLHASRNRINVWSSAGELLQARSMRFTPRMVGDIEGTDDGGFIGFIRRRVAGDASRLLLVGVSPEGERERDYVELPGNQSLFIIQGSRGKNTGIPRPISDFAVAKSGRLYATAGSDYTIVAYEPDGSPRWALQVPWPRLPLTTEDIQAALQRVMARSDVGPGLSNVSRSEVRWPELMPALIGSMVDARLEPLEVDGHGHLYVFPFIPADWNRPEQPVDVYSAEGEQLFSGMMPMVNWDAARGDHVYGIRLDPDTEEYTAVRYRLVEPFD